MGNTISTSVVPDFKLVVSGRVYISSVGPLGILNQVLTKSDYITN